MKGLLLLAALGASTGSLPLQATTIVSTNVGGYAAYYPVGLQPVVGSAFATETTWTQTGTYVNVAISVPIDPGGSPTVSHSFSGTAYLTTQIGPGTTTANQLASVPFSVTGTEFSPIATTLFSGLTLGPGTYYLVLSAPASQAGGWEAEDLGITPIRDAGVSLGAAGNADGVEASYAPATSFNLGSNNPSNTNLLAFTVTGSAATATPEPSTLLLAAVGIAVLANRRRR